VCVCVCLYIIILALQHNGDVSLENYSGYQCTLFKKKINYPDFLHIQISRRPN